MTVALDWCNRCFTKVGGEQDQAAVVEALAQPAESFELGSASYSRWRGGPTTLGPVARMLLTLLIVGFVVAVAAMFQEAIFTPQAVLALATVLAGSVGALAFIWRRGQV
jgi:hypothetical protein